MERIAIIDHDLHVAYIEDLDEDLINEKYNGNEEDYIKDTYTLHEHWSWDYITSLTYYPKDGDPICADDLELLAE